MGLLGHDSVNNENRAWRNEDAQGASGGHRPGCQAHVVGVFFHLRQSDGAHCGGGGAGRTTDRGETSRGRDGSNS